MCMHACMHGSASVTQCYMVYSEVLCILQCSYVLHNAPGKIHVSLDQRLVRKTVIEIDMEDLHSMPLFCQMYF